MASGKLYTYPDNFRADKIRAVANISGYNLQVAPEYVHGVTNKTDEFQGKFFGKVPAFESGDTTLCDDTAIAHFVGNQQTRGGDRTHDVICWAGFAEGNLLPAVAQWVWPTLGIVAPNKNHVNDAKANLKDYFTQLNAMLANQTFMVGERITYADITCALTLRSAYENVFTPEWRAPFPHVNRWFMTVVNQPGVKSVIGDVKLCVKEAQFDAKKFAEVSGKGGKDNKKAAKKDQPKKEAAPKKEKKAAPAAEPEKPKEAKPADPWGNCGKFTMDMDAWKRFFSNNPEEQSIEHFWTLITPEVKQNYSLWYADYSYADELTMDFMAANLVGGMFQRIEKLRKHAFASVIVGGTTRDLNITGLWFWRGDSLAFERSPDWQIDYEVYKWTKLDWDAPETKEMVYKYWKWDEAAKFGGKAFNEGKIYK